MNAIPLGVTATGWLVSADSSDAVFASGASYRLFARAISSCHADSTTR